MIRQNYPAEWQDVIRPAVLRRDNYKCTNCGATHRTWGYYDNTGAYIECDDFMRQWCLKHHIHVHRVFLQVAHIDRNSMNCADSNLRTLCPRCHLNYDRAANILLRNKPPG